MDNALDALLSLNFLFFCLGLAAITFVIRKLVEYYILDNPKFPGTRKSAFWNDLLLPIAPVVNGVFFALIAKKYPFPDIITSSSGRFFFGLTAGLLSGLIYRVIRGMLKAKINIYIGGNSSSADDGYSAENNN